MLIQGQLDPVGSLRSVVAALLVALPSTSAALVLLAVLVAVRLVAVSSQRNGQGR